MARHVQVHMPNDSQYSSALIGANTNVGRWCDDIRVCLKLTRGVLKVSGVIVDPSMCCSEVPDGELVFSGAELVQQELVGKHSDI